MATNLGNTPKPIFISYAHVDNKDKDPKKRWLDRLLVHLEPIRRQGDLTICSDQNIDLGHDWHDHIQTHLNGAKAAILLVSSNFLASKYISSNEMPILLRKAKEQGVKIIPILVGPCLFEETMFKYPDPKEGPEEFSLASLQAAGSPNNTLLDMDEAGRERTLLSVAKNLLQLVHQDPQ